MHFAGYQLRLVFPLDLLIVHFVLSKQLRSALETVIVVIAVVVENYFESLKTHYSIQMENYQIPLLHQNNFLTLTHKA